MYDVVLTGKIRRIDSNGAYLDGTATNNQTLCDTAKSLVRQVNISINGNEKINCNKMNSYWSILEQLEEDNEDESLAYYIKADEVIKSDGTQLTQAEVNTGTIVQTAIIDEKDICAREIFAEKVQRLRKLGYLSAGINVNDRSVLYSARQHFIIPGHEPPAFALGKIDFRFYFDSAGLTVAPGM